MKVWRVEIAITHPTRVTRKEFGIYPAPTLEGAIDLAKWADSLYPPIKPFAEQTRNYSGREALAGERDSYLHNIEAEG